MIAGAALVRYRIPQIPRSSICMQYGCQGSTIMPGTVVVRSAHVPCPAGDRPMAVCRRSAPQSLVALPSRAKVAVMAAMGSKSREVIYGGRIIGAKIRAEGARAAQKAVREADRAAAAMVDPDGSLWRTGATIADDRAMPQWWLRLATSQMPSL
jgi:hypothetical protein